MTFFKKNRTGDFVSELGTGVPRKKLGIRVRDFLKKKMELVKEGYRFGMVLLLYGYCFLGFPFAILY